MSYNSLASDSALLAKWVGDGNATDSGPNGYTLTWNGDAPSYVTGAPFGRQAFSCLVGQWLSNTSFATAAAGKSKFTLAGWIRVPSFIGQQHGAIGPVSTDTNRTLIQVSPGTTYWCVCNGSSSYPNNAGAAYNTWAHYALVFDGALTGNARITPYVNGSLVSLVGGGSVPDPTTGNGSYAVIGARNNTGSGTTRAQYSDVQAFTRALNASEVLELYNGPEPTIVVDPVAAVNGQGLTLTSVGTWNAYSNGTLSYTYQWQKRVGVSSWLSIQGADQQSYTVSQSGTYRCSVIATNNGGASLAATSNAVDALGPNLGYASGSFLVELTNPLLSSTIDHPPLPDASVLTVPQFFG